MKPSPKTIRLAVRLERLPAIEFERSDRSALPRKPNAGLDYVKITPGVPEPIRSRLGSNIFVSAFPYPQWLHGSGKRIWREHRMVELESDRWRIVVCPDVGGRILSLFDKKISRELLWSPTALNFASVGLPGAWLLGGIEFNAFRFGHCVHGMMTLQTERVELAGGMTGLRWGAVDELLECEWSVILVPLAERVAVQVTLKNHSRRPQPGYWWTNIAIPARQGTRLFYQPSPVLHHGFDMGMVYEPWPWLNGNDWQYWQSHSSVISAYWPEYGSDVFGYAMPGEDWAMMHHADRKMARGRKLWSVGSGHDADVWMERCGEGCAESYCEIQSGRSPTQLESDLLEPGARLTWVESFGTIPCPREGDAAAGFGEFERNAAAPLDADTPALAAPDFWHVTKAEILVEEDPRITLSRKAVSCPGTLTSDEIAQAVRQGWVGGSPWIRILESTHSEPWRDLALGGARLDLNEPGAAALLTPLTHHDDKCGGFAALLLGHRAQQDGQLEPAIAHLRQAVARLPENLEAMHCLHQALLMASRVNEARQLWQGVRGTIGTSDVARFARAQVAFLERRWQDARAELESEMPCIGENSFGSWLLRKEIELADAFECQAAGQFEEAQNRLMAACRFMPQFGVGRYETSANVDMLYYRWLLARLADARIQAEALASRLFRFRPYVGSTEAAYLLRLAKLLNDPSAPARAAAFADWNAQAGDQWPKLLPLRLALSSDSRAAWTPLENDLLYRYRARFEQSLIQPQTNSEPPPP